MNLQPINGTASKQEEIDLLNKVAKLFGKGTYMADFLNEATLGWVESQLKDDFPPELYEALQSECNEHGKTLSKLLKVQQELEQEIRLHGATASGYAGQVDRLAEEVKRLKEDRISYIDSMSSSIDEVRAERNDAEAKLMVAQTEVNRLKIEVYDLTHPK